METARARERKGGRHQGMTKEAEQKAILAETYYREEQMGVNQIALEIGIYRSSKPKRAKSELQTYN